MKARQLGHFEPYLEMQVKELIKSTNNINAEQIGDGVITPVKLFPGLIPASERQMIWQGKKDYLTDTSTFLSTTLGQLKVSLLGATVPFVCTIANGFDKNNGQIDYIVGINSDVIEAWTLPANKSFLQLYIEYDPSTKTVIYGSTELETVYLFPSAPSADQHWFDKGNYKKMMRWNGTTWEDKIRIMVGEVVTDASSVTSVIAYAVQSQFDSGWIAVTANQNITLNHNIGILIPDGLQARFYFSLDSSGIDSSLAVDGFNNGSVWEGHLVKENVTNITRNYIKFGFYNYVQHYRGSPRTSGYYRTIITRSWD